MVAESEVVLSEILGSFFALHGIVHGLAGIMCHQRVLGSTLIEWLLIPIMDVDASNSLLPILDGFLVVFLGSSLHRGLESLLVGGHEGRTPPSPIS